MYERVHGSRRPMPDASLSCPPHYLLKQGVPQNPELVDSGQLVPEVSCLWLVSSGVTDSLHHLLFVFLM